MILVSHGSAEQSHDPVAHHLVDGALVVVDGFHHALEDGVEEPPRFLGITVGEQLHRALQVREEHRDLLALTFQGRLRGQDLLGEVLRGVRVSGTRTESGSGGTPAGRPHSEQNLADVESAAPQCPQDRARGAPHSSQNLACGRFSRWHRGQGMSNVSRVRIAAAGHVRASQDPGSRRAWASRPPPGGARQPDPTVSRPLAPAWLPLPVGPLADSITFRLGGVAEGGARSCLGRLRRTDSWDSVPSYRSPGRGFVRRRQARSAASPW